MQRFIDTNWERIGSRFQSSVHIMEFSIPCMQEGTASGMLNSIFPDPKIFYHWANENIPDLFL